MGGGVPVACRIDRLAIRHPATGLAASPGALYKFVVGGVARLPFLCAIAISGARRGLPARRGIERSGNYRSDTDTQRFTKGPMAG